MALRKEDLGNNDDRAAHTTKRSRITIDINPELRRRIKLAALQEDLSISDYLARILEQSVPKETSMTQQEYHPITREAIERLKSISEKIMQDRGGKLFEDTAEVIRQMREERSKYLEEL
jgi:predicted metal-dependent RNase